MADREKVVKGLEIISDYFFDIYRKDTDGYKCEKAQEYSDIAIDAISLLKEQEAVMPKVSSVEQRCGNCNKVIEMDGWKVCPWCGKMIDWERWWKKNGTRNQDT